MFVSELLLSRVDGVVRSVTVVDGRLLVLFVSFGGSCCSFGCKAQRGDLRLFGMT